MATPDPKLTAALRRLRHRSALDRQTALVAALLAAAHAEQVRDR